MNLKDLKKKVSWHDFLLIAIILLLILLQVNLVSNLKQLPSPLYGGDLYHQLGAINHVKYGGNPLVNFHNDDPIPNYFPLYTGIVGGAARIFNLESMQAMFLFSYIFTILSVIIFYFLGIILFKNKNVALLLPLIYYSILTYKLRLVIKYSYFAALVMLPLFFMFLILTLLKSSENNKTKYVYAAITSILYGLCSLSHGVMFPTLTILMVLIFIYLFFYNYLHETKFKIKKWKEDLKENLSTFLLLAIPGFLISQLYWYHIIKGVIFNPRSEASILLNMNANLEYSALNNIFETIFNFSNMGAAFVTLLFLLSIVILFSLKKYKEVLKTLRFLFISTLSIIIILIIIPFLTGTSFTVILHKVISIFQLPLMIAILTTLSLYILLKIIKRKNKAGQHIIIILVLIFLLFTNYSGYKDYESYKWYETGTEPLPSYYTTIADYINANTDVNDVILTNKELGFSVNAFTGRKLVAHPPGHKTLIYDLSTREKDLAIMLYGDDSAPREELFEKYNVKYFYWDYYWIHSEFIFNQEGQIVGLFDPIELLNTDENKEILDKYNIRYTEEKLELNPNLRGTVMKYDVLLVYPQFNLTHPWSSSLDEFLNLEKEIKIKDQIGVRLYKVIY
ncbi:MAG: hypothetical protein JSW73_05130 [Candidatus Woesearchaeota archaeon]|nr:MAG: hypothetical protein JSW73_05130 [Candidatus Woesearchaeota archaeon]